MLRWGLIPHWAKDTKIAFKMINARAETLTKKPAYRGLLRSRRCLIPADGFNEWRAGADGKKEPVRFTLADGEPFAFAGLWTSWRDPERDLEIVSCTVVTTTANGRVAPVHDRMPVIRPPDLEAAWLSHNVDRPEAVSLLRPYPAELMAATPASRLVNSARHDGPELLAGDAVVDGEQHSWVVRVREPPGVRPA
jgi:putative SOS response-associated peptidase YedK